MGDEERRGEGGEREGRGGDKSCDSSILQFLVNHACGEHSFGRSYASFQRLGGYEDERREVKRRYHFFLYFFELFLFFILHSYYLFCLFFSLIYPNSFCLADVVDPVSVCIRSQTV